MKKAFAMMFTLLIGSVLLAACSSGDSKESKGDSDITEITYWQYTFPTKVEEIDKIIADFEKENPDIKVVAQDFPYDQFQNKIFAAVEAGNGPDIMNIYNGWISKYVDMDYIQPIREEFMSKDEISDYYVDMIQPYELDGEHYTLPVAVRSLALFWNKDMYKEAGLDPESPPKTWDELIENAKAMTEMTDDGRYKKEGFGWNAAGQGLHEFQQVLLRQYGVDPYSEDTSKVLWNEKQEGYDAFKYWMDMTMVHKIGDPDVGNTYREAFLAGLAGMIVDGSFAVGDIQDASFDWGVTTLPVLEEGGLQSNYASYWTNAIAKGVEGEKLEASEKFLAYLIQEDVQKEWLENIGELPASKALIADEELVNDPTYGPFIEGLEYAHATFFVNEDKERQIIIDGVDKIRLENADYDETLDDIVKKIQEVRDEFFNKQ